MNHLPRSTGNTHNLKNFSATGMRSSRKGLSSVIRSIWMSASVKNHNTPVAKHKVAVDIGSSRDGHA